jgi:hypothetical protein
MFSHSPITGFMIEEVVWGTMVVGKKTRRELWTLLWAATQPVCSELNCHSQEAKNCVFMAWPYVI